MTGGETGVLAVWPLLTPAKCHFQTAEKSEYHCVLSGENAHAHLTTYGERAMRADREMEGAMGSIGGVVGEGGGVKWKCRRGTMELYKSKQVHLITGF